MSNDLVIQVSAKEIMNKIDDNYDKTDKKLDKIHEQVKKTNGRVTSLEHKSWGKWVAEHPIKFAFILLIIILFLISDSRNVIMELVKLAF